MAADSLDVRMARLEGAYEQINRRLAVIEERLGDLDRKIDRVFYFMIGTWVTLLLAIFFHR